MSDSDKSVLLKRQNAGVLVKDTSKQDFERWLNRVEYRGKNVLPTDGKVQRQPGELTRLMLVLNLIGFVFHVGAFIGEVIAGARFNMYLELYTNKVTATINTSVAYNSSTTTYTYTAAVAHDVYVTWVAMWIHFLSIGFHACISLFLGLSYYYQGAADWYMRGLYRCRAPWRWLEYFFSASLMIYLLTIMMGVRDTSVVTATTGLCGVTILFGWITEVGSSYLIDELDTPVKGYFGWECYYKWKDNTRLDRLGYMHVLGYAPFCLMFYIVLDSFFKHRNALGDDYPGYTDYTVIGTLFLFLMFGVTQFVQQWNDYGPSWYALGEASYVALSFLAKAWLVVIVTAQTLANDQFDRNLNAKFS